MIYLLKISRNTEIIFQDDNASCHRMKKNLRKAYQINDSETVRMAIRLTIYGGKKSDQPTGIRKGSNKLN